MTLEVKMDIVRRYEEGQRTADIVKATGFSESTLRTVRAAKDRITACIAQGSSAAAKRVHNVRSAPMSRMEEMLKDWVLKQNRRNIPMSMGVIQTKAREIYVELTMDDDNPKPFQASSGWFANFKNRHGLHNVKFTGEAASADVSGAEDYIKELHEYIETHGYKPEQVFNLDETSLYPYRTFERSYISVAEKKKPGVKPSKKRVTLLLGTNLVGHKLKPVLIGTAAKPHCFRGVIVENLPLYYYHNQKGWMDSYIWGHYTSFNLENELRDYCKEKNVDFKILLLCDNFSGHNDYFTVASDFITVKFLPANTTSIIQPMDQGIIRMLKCNYTKISLQRMINKIDSEPDGEDHEVVMKYWSSFNLKNAIYVLQEAWECVTEKCIQGAWRKLCPNLVPDFAGFDMVTEEARLRKELLDHARQVGFDELDDAEVTNLIESHDQALTTEELIMMQKEREEEAEREREKEDKDSGTMKQLNMQDLGRMFACFDEGMKIMEDCDLQPDRVFKVQQNIRQALRCYYDLQRKLRSLAKQRTPSAPSSKPDTPEPSALSEAEAEPDAEPKPSSSRQLTLYESLTSTSSFKGFEKSGEKDLPDLLSLSDSDNE